MWGNSWFHKIVMTWALVIASIALLLVITSISGLISDNSALVASWVQALGSIIAIVVGAKAIQWQVREGIRRSDYESLVRVDSIFAALFNCRRCVVSFVRHAGGFEDAIKNAREAIWWMNSLSSIPLSECPSLGVLHSVGFISAELEGFKGELAYYMKNPTPDFKFHVAGELVDALEQAEIAVEKYLNSKGATGPDLGCEIDGTWYYPAGRTSFSASGPGSIEGSLVRQLKQPRE